MENNFISQKMLKNEIHTFLDSINISQTTKNSYHYMLKDFIKRYDDSLTPTQNYNMHVHQLQKNVSNNYIVLKTGIIKRFLKYVGVSTTSMGTFERIDDKRDYIPIELIRQLIKYNSGRPLQEMIILISTGLRCGDLARMKYGDVNFEERCLMVPQSKGNKSYLVPLSDSLLHYLQYELKDFNDGRPFLWYGQKTNKPIGKRTIEMDINKAGRLIKMHNLCPTHFRHTYLTLLIELGMDPICADMCLGHSQKGHVSNIYNHNIEPSFGEIQQEFDNISKQFDKVIFGKNTEVPKQAKLNTLDSLFQ